jgi:hypothetical protein
MLVGIVISDPLNKLELIHKTTSFIEAQKLTCIIIVNPQISIRYK